jgi:hypothetical protein
MSQSVSSTRASKAPLTNVGGKSEVIKTPRDIPSARLSGIYQKSSAH